MLWEFRGPVRIEEKTDAPGFEGQAAYRWHCLSKDSCRGRDRVGKWQRGRPSAERGGGEHYQVKHQ